MPKGLAFYDQQHLQKMLMQQQCIASVFNSFVAAVSPQLRKWTDHGKGNVWVRNSGVESFIDKELIKLQAVLMSSISSSQTDAWKRSMLKNDELIERFIQGMAITESVKKGMFEHNLNTFDAFQKRKDNGLNLSQKVWNVTEQAKTQLEYYLGTGLSVGRGADVISRDVRQMLDKPDMRFRRTRDEDGKLRPSKPMQNYHPGIGNYRSSKMNALRLSSTETNMAYRKADHERWQNMDFVIGFEVKRSGNNKGPCSLCDAMVGKYPKTYQFTGNHPFCICFAVPLLMDHEDFADYLLNDAIPEDKIIKTIPDSASDWVENRKEQAKGWSNTPYFVRDNKKFFREVETNTYTVKEKKFTRAGKTKEAMSRAVNYFSKEYPDIPNTELASIHHYTKKGGNYRQLNKQLFNDNLTDFNAASSELMSNGLEKLPIFKGTVHRGSIMKKNLFEELYSDKDVVHSIFTSTTKDKEVAINHFVKYKAPKKSELRVLFEIKSKKGKDISSLSEFNGKFAEEDQKEILFDKGTKFKIVSIEDKMGYKLVKLKET